MDNMKYIAAIFTLGLLIISCKTEDKGPFRDSINILLPQDPERLNPVYDARSIGREVFQYICVPVADFHPETLELYPILIKSIPALEKVDEGAFYEIEFLEDAKWQDGESIDAEDYLFTLKSVLLPDSAPKAWKPLLKKIKSAVIDPNNSKKVKVFVDENYMLGLEVITTVYVLPEHNYKNTDVLKKYTLQEIQQLKLDETNDEGIQLFLDDFNDSKHYTDGILGNGPYQLRQWESDQYVLLDKVEDYWGADHPTNPFLQANIPSMQFKIMEDEMTALTAFKDKGIDVINGLSALNFETLKNEMPNAGYLTAPSSRFYYIAINNQNPILKDRDVRQALSNLIDLKGMLENIEYGYGEALSGPIHPKQPYYDKSLNPYHFDLEEAKELLEKDGWSDTNGDETIDKIIEGKKEELELDLLIAGGELGEKIALLFQSEAKKVGIQINIVTKDIRRMRSENLYSYDYDLAALAEGQDISPIDPYRRWHSDNVHERGSNICAYKSEKADELIEKIRETKDIKQRESLYKEFHQLLYVDQPVIFLFSPSQKILVSEDFDASATPKRPGYMANTFKVNSAK